MIALPVPTAPTPTAPVTVTFRGRTSTLVAPGVWAVVA